MTIVIKPDMTRVWAAGAAGGDVEDPDTTSPGKFDQGWLAEIPPHENFNFLQKLFTEGLLYLSQNGLADYDALTDYPVNTVQRGSDGNIYIAAIINGPDTSVVDPVGDVTGTWLLWHTNYVDMKSGRKNYVINPNLDIWQRGVSFPGNNEYTADRFNVDSGGGTLLVTRETFAIGQTDVPNEPTYFMKLLNTVAAGVVYNLIAHRVEGVRTLAGKKAILSFWAKIGSPKTFDIHIRQNFGSGGSATVIPVIQAINVTTSWQKFEIPVTLPSISGKTLGANNNIDFIFREQSFTTFQLDVAQFQLEEGEVSTDFEYRPIAEELALCQRYYENNYPDGNYPGDNIPSLIASFITEAPQSGTNNIYRNIDFKTRKRITPSMTSYSGSGVAGNYSYASGGASGETAITAFSGYEDNAQATFLRTWAANANNRVQMYWEADAEL